MICSNCKETINDGSRFCQFCGAKQEQKKICSNCGTELEAVARFCFNCGTPVGENASAHNSGNPFDTSTGVESGSGTQVAGSESAVFGFPTWGETDDFGGDPFADASSNVQDDPFYHSDWGQSDTETQATNSDSAVSDSASNSGSSARDEEDDYDFDWDAVLDIDTTPSHPEIQVIDGEPVILHSVSNNEYEGMDILVDVVIADEVTKIGDHAFRNCTELTSVTIPNSVTEIGDSAFENCSELTNVTIPGSVTKIGKNAFHGCGKLFLDDLVKELSPNADFPPDMFLGLPFRADAMHEKEGKLALEPYQSAENKFTSEKYKSQGEERYRFCFSRHYETIKFSLGDLQRAWTSIHNAWIFDNFELIVCDEELFLHKGKANGVKHIHEIGRDVSARLVDNMLIILGSKAVIGFNTAKVSVEYVHEIKNCTGDLYFAGVYEDGTISIGSKSLKDTFIIKNGSLESPDMSEEQIKRITDSLETIKKKYCVMASLQKKVSSGFDLAYMHNKLPPKYGTEVYRKELIYPEIKDFEYQGDCTISFRIFSECLDIDLKCYIKNGLLYIPNTYTCCDIPVFDFSLVETDIHRSFKDFERYLFSIVVSDCKAAGILPKDTPDKIYRLAQVWFSDDNHILVVSASRNENGCELLYLMKKTREGYYIARIEPTGVVFDKCTTRCCLRKDTIDFIKKNLLNMQPLMDYYTAEKRYCAMQNGAQDYENLTFTVDELIDEKIYTISDFYCEITSDLSEWKTTYNLHQLDDITVIDDNIDGVRFSTIDIAIRCVLANGGQIYKTVETRNGSEIRPLIARKILSQNDIPMPCSVPQNTITVGPSDKWLNPGFTIKCIKEGYEHKNRFDPTFTVIEVCGEWNRDNTILVEYPNAIYQLCYSRDGMTTVVDKCREMSNYICTPYGFCYVSKSEVYVWTPGGEVKKIKDNTYDYIYYSDKSVCEMFSANHYLILNVIEWQCNGTEDFEYMAGGGETRKHYIPKPKMYVYDLLKYSIVGAAKGVVLKDIKWDGSSFITNLEYQSKIDYYHSEIKQISLSTNLSKEHLDYLSEHYGNKA